MLFCFVLLFLVINKQQSSSTYRVIESSNANNVYSVAKKLMINNSVSDSAVFNQMYDKHLWGLGSGVGSQESNTV